MPKAKLTAKPKAKPTSNQKLSNPLEEMNRMNETAQQSLGISKKDWMNTSLPPQQQPQTHGSTSNPSTASRPDSGIHERGEDTLFVSDIDGQDAREILWDSEPPPKRPFNLGRFRPQDMVRKLALARETEQGRENSLLQPPKNAVPFVEADIESAIPSELIGPQATSLQSQVPGPEGAFGSIHIPLPTTQMITTAHRDIALPSVLPSIETQQQAPAARRRTGRTDYNLPVLTMLQFSKPANLNNAETWADLRTRVQSRTVALNAAAHRVPIHFRTLLQQRLRLMDKACVLRDSRFLLLLQASAILKSYRVQNMTLTEPLQTACAHLKDIFLDVDEENRTWFLDYPCACPPDIKALRRNFETLGPDIITLAFFYDNLSRTCVQEKRLPRIVEIDTALWDSRHLQSSVFEAVLGRYWLGDTDQCYLKIQAFFNAALWQREQYLSTTSSVSLDVQLKSARDYADMNIAMWLKTHQSHMAPDVLQPVETGFRQLSVDDEGEARSASRIKTESPFRRMALQTSQLRANLLTQHTVSTRPVAFSFSNQTAPSVQQVSQSMSTPVSQAQSQDNEELVSNETIKAAMIDSSVAGASRPVPALPVHQTAPRMSETGTQLIHAHLQDPVTIPFVDPDEIEYRSYMTNSFLSKPLTFMGNNVYHTKEFDLTENMLQKFPIEYKEGHWQETTRRVHSGHEIVRLRGTSSKRPRTFSDWYLAETCWPSSINVQLNGEAIEFRRKPHYAKDLAVDVTSRLKVGTNRIDVRFVWIGSPPADFEYTIALETAVIQSLDRLRYEIESEPRSDTEKQLKSHFARSSGSGEEMILDHVDVSLRDPLTSRWPKVPVRTVYCTHFECFDLDAFLKSRPKDLNQPDQFLCPICGKDARPMNVKVDGLMDRILKYLEDNNKTDATMIRISSDRTCTVIAEAQVITIEDSDDE